MSSSSPVSLGRTRDQWRWEWTGDKQSNWSRQSHEQWTSSTPRHQPISRSTHDDRSTVFTPTAHSFAAAERHSMNWPDAHPNTHSIEVELESRQPLESLMIRVRSGRAVRTPEMREREQRREHGANWTIGGRRGRRRASRERVGRS
jgi:hypothetical protein